METLKSSETLIEGLVPSKPYVDGNPDEGTFKSFDLGEENCAESISELVAEKGCIDTCNANGFEPVSQSVPTGTESGVDSTYHEDVPMKGISLVVELTGGVTNDVSQGHALDGGLFNRNQHEVIVGHGESRVNVGDFVWAIVKKQSWWPGIVCDASSAPKEVVKIQKTEDCILVRCFGDESYLWCLPGQLKPFVGHFEQFSKQSKSKRFVGALEKAVAEFGERKGDVGNLSSTRLEPAGFLRYIKDLARDVSISSMINCAIIKYCLSAFYRSLGHCQIPVHQLKPTNSAKADLTFRTPTKIKAEEEIELFNEEMNTQPIKDINFAMGDDIKNSSGRSEKGYETRERRKSRFLSSPYTNHKAGLKGSPVPGEHEMEEAWVDINCGGVDMNKTADQPGKKPRKKGCRKQLKHDLPSEEVQTNVLPPDVISELHCAALDCLFPCQSKKFNSVEQFIAGFRKWAFNDSMSEITMERTVDQEFVAGMNSHIIFPELGVKSEEGMGMEVERTIDVVGTGAQRQFLPKRVGKKKNKLLSQIVDFQNIGSPAHGAPLVANKRMEMGGDQGIQNNDVMEPLPDMHENCSVLNFGDLPATDSAPRKLMPKRKRKCVASDTDIYDWNIDQSSPSNENGLVDLEGFNQASVFEFTDEIEYAPPCFPWNHGEPQAGLLSSTGNKEPKKRGRKRKSIDLQANLNSSPPSNVNGLVDNQATVFQRPHGTGFSPPRFPGNHGEPQVCMVSSIVNKEPKKRGRKRKNMDFQGNCNVSPPSNVKGLVYFEGFTPMFHLTNEIGSAPPCFPGNYGEPQAESNAGSFIMPDLNENSVEKKRGNRSRKEKETGVACIDLHYNKVQQDNGEVKGTAFLLKFSAEHPLPSIQDLNSLFCKYGPLNESETQISTENLSGQVVFLDSSSAGEAFWGLQNDQPFGQALVNYRIQHLAGADPKVEFKATIKTPVLKEEVMDPQPTLAHPVIPNLNAIAAENIFMKKAKTMEDIDIQLQQQGDGELAGTACLKNPNLNLNLGLNLKPVCQKGESPDLAAIRKNLEMMMLMVEKAGHTLSAEMRGKLESEIKGLMNKMSTMDGSSSSSL